MADKLIGEICTEILTPFLDENNIIPFVQAEKLLLENNVNLKGCDAMELFEDLDDFFEYITEEDGDKVKCLKVKKEEKPLNRMVDDNKTEVLNTEIEKQVVQKTGIEKPLKVWDEKEIKALNLKLVEALKSLERDFGDEQSYVKLSALGQRRWDMGLTIPGNEKFKNYIMRFPELFETKTTEIDTYVRLSGSMETKILPTSKDVFKPIPASNKEPQIPQVKNVSTTKRYISLYQMFDFASFPNYNVIMEQLADMAKPDGWFILQNENEKDPYMLLDMKLRSNFAMAVHKQLQGEDAGFCIRLDSASFETGFVTPEGAAIRAEFKLNQYRDSTIWQTWVFNGFLIVEV